MYWLLHMVEWLTKCACGVGRWCKTWALQTSMRGWRSFSSMAFCMPSRSRCVLWLQSRPAAAHSWYCEAQYHTNFAELCSQQSLKIVVIYAGSNVNGLIACCMECSLCWITGVSCRVKG